MRISDWSSDVCSSDLTDEWQAYITLKLRCEHVMIRKEKGRPVGRDHISGIEGFWSYTNELTVSVPRRAPAILPSVPGGSLLSLQPPGRRLQTRSEEHTSELQSLMRISYAVFCLKKKIPKKNTS